MPVFYCESCGKEVPAEVTSCPYCGKRFYSVKCPMCAYSGPASAFVSGCPVCGYNGPGYDNKASPMKRNGAVPKGKRKKKGMLPDWVYRVFLVMLLVSLAVLVKVYLSM